MRALSRLNTPEASRHLTNALRWFDPIFGRYGVLIDAGESSFPVIEVASVKNRFSAMISTPGRKAMRKRSRSIANDENDEDTQTDLLRSRSRQ